ncbi:MAG: NmrA family NAD(P)-binding protein [Parerythrobacter sp.]
MLEEMRVLVLGGTGNVGAPLVAQLRGDGVDVVAAARRGGGEAGSISLDMTDAATLAEQAKGYQAVYLATPLGPEETDIGLAAVEALRSAGVRKIVYLAIHNLESMAEIPHFETKIPIKEAVLSEPGGVVLQPNFFFQNDLMAIPAIMGAGVYPLPIGTAGVWSIDAADIARAAANALLSDQWVGQAVPLCGPDQLTGPAIAANWAAAKGAPVDYGGDGIEPFIDAMRRNVPDFSDWMAHDFTVMMEVTQDRGCPSTAEDRTRSEAIVGQPLLSHPEFVTATLAQGQPQENTP